MSRPYDIVVWGANGFTGRKVAKYLGVTRPAANGSSTPIRWAAAGRDAARVRAALCESGIPAGSVPEVLVADINAPHTLDEMCKKARVIIACAGPFANVGFPVAAACVRNGTHYVDITGEFPYVRTLVEKLHDAAVVAGVCVVPCCGFDSMPSDLVNWRLHRLAEAKGQRLVDVKTYFSVRGGFSRGTMDSILNIFETITKEDLHPLALVPRDQRGGIPKATSAIGVSYASLMKSWTCPFLMAGINEKVVRRSNFLMSRRAAYAEAMLGGFWTCLLVTTFVYVSGLLMIPFVRRLVTRWLPPARGGPSSEQTSKGCFTVVGFGSIAAASSAAQLSPLKATLKSDRGLEGYEGTAVMVSEAAIAIALGEFNADVAYTAGVVGATGRPSGVLTPAFTVGDALIRRLDGAGIHMSNAASL